MNQKIYFCDQCSSPVNYTFKLTCVHSDGINYRHPPKCSTMPKPVITIIVKSGRIQDVLNIPEGLEIEIKNLD